MGRQNRADFAIMFVTYGGERMCVAAQRRYAASTAAPAAARQFGAAAVIATVSPSGWNLADDAALVISELVSTAVKAGAGTLDVLLNLHRDRLEITVADDRRPAAEPTQARPVNGADPSLQILAALATTRGAELTADGRTSVWAHLPCDPATTTNITCAEPPR